MNPPTYTFRGRPCRISMVRVRHAVKHWGFYYRAIVSFEDGNAPAGVSMAAGEFNKEYEREQRNSQPKAVA